MACCSSFVSLAKAGCCPRELLAIELLPAEIQMFLSKFTVVILLAVCSAQNLG